MTSVLVTFGQPPADAAKDVAVALKIRFYVAKLQQHGLTPVFVWPGMQGVDVLYGKTAGLFLTGGGDIDATRYREWNHPTADHDAPGRDELEFSLIERALADGKPILGVCRGAQAIAVVRGGKLMQHLPEVVREQHGKSEHLHTADDLVRARGLHEVVIDPASHVYGFVRKERALVNTFHHQAILDPGKGMRVVGRSPEGVAEIIEAVDPATFCVGIQSHPERFVDSDLEPLFVAFARALR